MPVLDDKLAKQAEEADTSGGFAALDPGVYTGRLAKVEAKRASTGNPMWAVEFDQVKNLDGKRMPGRLFTNLVMTDTAMWKVSRFFGAYGVPTTTSTDELIGHRIRLQVEKRVIGAGARTGQEGNEISGFLPLTADDEGFGTLKVKGGKPPAKATGAKEQAAVAAPPAEPADDPWAGSAPPPVDF